MKKGIFYMVISALAFTLLNVFVKSLDTFSAYQIVFFRAVGSLFFTIPFLVKNQISMLGNKRTLLLARGVFGLVSMLLFFLSLKFITMGTAVSIRYIAPIFAAIFALVFLKERMRMVQWLFLGIAFSGVLIFKGFDNSLHPEGIFYALISAVFAGLVYITIRKIGNEDHPVVVVNYTMVISAIIGGMLSINHWVNPVGLEWLVLLSLGCFGYFAQLYMTKAMQICDTSKIAPFKYLEVIFTTIVGTIWLSETYTFYSLLGMFVIIIGLSLNLLLKEKKKKVHLKDVQQLTH